MKKIILTTILVAIFWSAFDFLIHNVYLDPEYQSTPGLWRTKEEIFSFWWMPLLTVVASFFFVWTYCCDVGNKSFKKGTVFGTKIGVIMGLGWFGMYCVLPISMHLAVVWGLSTVFALALGGAIVGKMIKECGCPK